MACSSCGKKYPKVQRSRTPTPVVTYVRSPYRKNAVRGVIKPSLPEVPKTPEPPKPE